MNRLFFLAAAATAALLLAGCNTPERRIGKKPALFASFPAEAQAKIRQGKVAPGFTRPMVEMALGLPDRTYRRESPGRVTELWVYVGLDLPPGVVREQDWAVVYSGKNGEHRRVVPLPRVPSNSGREREYDRVRVEFAPDGTVTCLEILQEK